MTPFLKYITKNTYSMSSEIVPSVNSEEFYSPSIFQEKLENIYNMQFMHYFANVKDTLRDLSLDSVLETGAYEISAKNGVCDLIFSLKIKDWATRRDSNACFAHLAVSSATNTVKGIRFLKINNFLEFFKNRRVYSS